MNINKNKKGFTLVEMLASVVIVILLTMVLTVLIGLATKYYTSTSEEAHAQSLASTLSNAIEDELRYATNIEIIGSSDDDEVVAEITNYIFTLDDPAFDEEFTKSKLVKAKVLDEDKKEVEVEVGYSNYTYFSSLSGMGAETTITNAIREINGENKCTIVLANDRSGNQPYPIINDSDYVYGLRAFVKSEYVAEDEKFNVVVTVRNVAGRTICENDFSVVPINPNA